nr:armadillo repeat-containing kinesin-like protein 2 [Tanacetum cinerariifolium]
VGLAADFLAPLLPAVAEKPMVLYVGLAADFLAPLLPAVAEKPMVLYGFVWFSSQVSFTVLLTKPASIGTGITSLVITIGPSPRRRTETASTILFGQMAGSNGRHGSTIALQSEAGYGSVPASQI